MSPNRRVSSMAGSPGGGSAGQKYYGVAVGIVTNNEDPMAMGRVKMSFPWLSDDHESNWARVCTPMAGNEWGAQFIPEVEDEVLVAFDRGDIRCPYVVGALYNGEDKPELTNSNGTNDIRQIKSRSGHIIKFDDTDGSEKLTIEDKSGNQLIEFDSAANTVTIKCGGETSFESTGKFTIKASEVEIKADTNIKIDAGANLEAKGSAGVKVEASGTTTIKGATVNIN